MKPWLTRAVCFACLLGAGTENQRLWATPQGTTPGGITISPASVDFGQQTVDTTSPAMPVVVSNSGQQSAEIDVLTSGIDFAQNNNCGATLAAGASCTVNVTFKPAIPGERIGTLNISTAFGSLPHTVVLTGTGK